MIFSNINDKISVIIIGLINMTVHNTTFNKDFYNQIKNEKVIIPFSNQNNISNSQLYISSITKGDHISDDQRSFAGWGYFMAEEKPNGNIFEFNQFGNLFNTDPVETSIKCAIQAIEKLRNTHNLEIVFENSYVPIMFSSDNILSAERNSINKLSRNDSEYWRMSRRADLLEKLKYQISVCKNINGLTIRYSPEKEHNEHLDNNSIFPDKEGFSHSQKSADKGFNKAVKGAIWFLINNQDKKNLGKSIVTCRKNLNNSYDATKEMMILLSEMKEGILPDSIRKKIVLLDLEKIIFPLNGMKSHSEKYNYIESNKEKIELILSRQKKSKGPAFNKNHDNKIELTSR